MRGIHVDCPKCKKKLFKDSYLRPGSFLTIKCFYCGVLISLIAEPGKLSLRSHEAPVENRGLTDDEDDDIIIVNL